uniref:Ig-like domain-containing protein n=1 Tax=Callorhinchus milii TaxID=7868 RepID=A0A4W3JK31_CALMI
MVFKGQPLYLTCELNKDRDVIWKKDGEVVENIPGKLTISVIGLQRSITISDSDFSDAGVYTVETANIKCEGKVSVQEIVRKWFVKPLRDQRVKQKETAVFQCEIAKDTPNIKWFKGEEEISAMPPSKFEIKKVGKILTLTLKNVSPEDQGEYTVEVEGQASTANLIVDGKIYFIYIYI